VKPTHSERRYSEEDMRRILEIATSAGPAHPDDRSSASGGFTLSEIREAGRQAGIDPSRIDRAAGEVSTRSGIRASLGVGTFQQERVLPHALAAEDMAFVVQHAPRVFAAAGDLRSTATRVEWYSGEARAFVGMVRGEAHTRLRVIVDRTREVVGGAAVLGLAGLFIGTEFVRFYGGVPGALGAVGTGGATLGLVAAWWSWRRRVALKRVDGLLDLMEGDASLQAPDEVE